MSAFVATLFLNYDSTNVYNVCCSDIEMFTISKFSLRNLSCTKYVSNPISGG